MWYESRFFFSLPTPNCLHRICCQIHHSPPPHLKCFWRHTVPFNQVLSLAKTHNLLRCRERSSRIRSSSLPPVSMEIPEPHFGLQSFYSLLTVAKLAIFWTVASLSGLESLPIFNLSKFFPPFLFLAGDQITDVFRTRGRLSFCRLDNRHNWMQSDLTSALHVKMQACPESFNLLISEWALIWWSKFLFLKVFFLIKRKLFLNHLIAWSF